MTDRTATVTKQLMVLLKLKQSTRRVRFSENTATWATMERSDRWNTVPAKEDLNPLDPISMWLHQPWRTAWKTLILIMMTASTEKILLFTTNRLLNLKIRSQEKDWKFHSKLFNLRITNLNHIKQRFFSLKSTNLHWKRYCRGNTTTLSLIIDRHDSFTILLYLMVIRPPMSIWTLAPIQYRIQVKLSA